MSDNGAGPPGLAENLRRAFDRSFAEAPRVHTDPIEDLLAVRAGGRPYALVFRDIGGLLERQPITPLPSAVPALLGLAGIRGAVVPVYDLRLLLGHSSTGSSRWLVLAGSRETVALAFDEFEGYLRIARSDLTTDDSSGIEHVHGAARTPAGSRPIVDLASVLRTIGKTARADI